LPKLFFICLKIYHLVPLDRPGPTHRHIGSYVTLSGTDRHGVHAVEGHHS
jgi:hypothetical protein